MAESLFEDFLTCPVCLETFKEPLSLGCNHSFCSECLNSYWQKNSCQTCPVCRRKSSKEVVVVNFALRELAASFKDKAKAEEVECARHPEEIRLFCLDDGRTLCPICEFSKHSRHTVLEVEKAASEVRERLEKRLKALRARRETVEKLTRSYDAVQEHSDKQAERCQRQIRAEFRKLYRFLKKEEESKMEELREEQRRQAEAMSTETKRIQAQLDALNRSISTMEEQEKLSRNSVDFLKQYKQSLSEDRKQESEGVSLKMGPGLLINEAKLLGNVGFRVWEKMRSLVRYSPVILDANTVSAKLCLSDDLTGVRYAENRRDELPDNPERFTNDEIAIGAEGFGPGTKRSWTVEVGDCPRWDVGVVKESVDRRGEVFSDAEFGIWCLWHGDGAYNDGDSDHGVKVKKPPVRVKVTLDYDDGRLSFYDGDDMTLLCTHQHDFTERLFPYVCVGPSAGADNAEVKICT